MRLETKRKKRSLSIFIHHTLDSHYSLFTTIFLYLSLSGHLQGFQDFHNIKSFVSRHRRQPRSAHRMLLTFCVVFSLIFQ